MKSLLVAALLLALLLMVEPAIRTTADLVSRGKRLTRSTLVDGVVAELPEELTAAAEATTGRDITAPEYALARMLRSEAGAGAPAAKIAIAHVALNDARALGWTLTKTLTYNANRPAGRFGQQRGGRYSTARDPYENDLTIAQLVLGGEYPDPTDGAVKFVHRGAFGWQPGTGSYASVVERWAAEGLEPVELPDVGDLVVFRRRVGVS